MEEAECPDSPEEEEEVEAEVNTIAQSQLAQAICPAPEEASAVEGVLLLARLAQERLTLVVVVAAATGRG